MQKSMPDIETHLQRLDIVRSWSAQGKSVPELVATLSEKGLFAPGQSYAARYRATQRLLAKVRKDNAERYRVTKEEADSGLVAYIERQTLLLQLAIESNQLETARGLSKDLARANGIDTERPVRAEETDLFTLMSSMAARARNKPSPLPMPTPAIDVTPDIKSG